LPLVAALYSICSTAAAAEPPAVIDIPRAKSAPAIDGKLNDDCWSHAARVPVEYLYRGDGQATSPPPMIARLLWDEGYLYLGYEVSDSDLVAVGNGKEVGPAGNRRPASEEWLPEKNLDLVECFVSFGSRQKFWEIHHTAGNHLNNHWCEVPDEALLPGAKTSIDSLKLLRDRFIPDEGLFTVARAVSLKPKKAGGLSTVNDSSDEDTGYFGELRLPWGGLGAPAERRRAEGRYAMSGARLTMLLAILNGNDGKPAYHSSAADLPAQMFHFLADHWPRYELAP
jgi:hypothetical protein